MKISIRMALISVILGLIWVTYVLTTSTTYLSSQKTLRQHAHDIMENIARLAMQEAFTHLNHAQDATVLTKRLLSDEIVTSDMETVAALEQYFYNNMAINPHFAGIYLGMPDGSFYDVRRHEEKAANGFRTKIIAANTAGERHTRLIWRNAAFQIVGEEADPNDTYDPRKRPWYEKALQEREIVWTDPYIFYSSRKPGITIAGPSFDKEGRLKGVIGVDIEIDQLSTFIAGLKIGKRGRAFMLSRIGDVVAHPNLDKLRWRDQPDGDQYRLVTIDELNDPVSQKAFEALAKETDLNTLDRSKVAAFRFNNQAFTAMLAPFTSWKWPWFICVYLPEDDYLGELKENRRLNMILTFVISLLATAIGLFVAGGIVHPISALESEASSIKEGDFDSPVTIHSPYTEIRATSESFQLMKHAVQTSQQRYQRIFENIQDVYFEATLDGGILEVSPSVERVFGFERSTLIGSSLVDYVYETADLARLKDTLVEKGRCHDFQIEMKREPDTDLAHGSINAKLVVDSQGQPVKLVGSLRDITRRKAAEQELERHRRDLEAQVKYRTQDLEKINIELTREIEQRQAITDELAKREEEYFNLYNLNRMVTNNVPDLIWAKDLDGRYIFANQAICDKLLMCEHPEATFGKTDTYFAESERQKGYNHTFGEICENSDEITLSKQSAGRFLEDGLVRNTYLALDVYKAPFINENGEIIGTVGCGRDVTKERAMEKELQLTEERFRELFEETSDLIHSVDQNGTILMVNKAWSKTLKYDEKEIIGKSLLQVIHTDQVPECRRFLARSFEGEALENIEVTFVAKDGERVHAVGNLTPRVIDKKIVATQAIFHNITDRKKNEQAILEAHADLERRVEDRTAALTKANDLLREKIAESKQAEERLSQAYADLQSTQTQLIQAAKLASIGELASGVAHELNQPLMVIRGNAQLIKKTVGNRGGSRSGMLDSIRLVESNTKRMMNIIDHLRSFSRQSRLEFSAVDVNATLADALMMVGEQLRLQRVTVVKRLARNLPTITGDANQLEQTFLNLLTNARDAIIFKNDQTAEDATGDRDAAHTITIQTGRSAGDEQMLEVRIEDTGCGIEAENVSKIFDPFFTTKQVGQGTGLGLSISYGIIQDHGGSIAVADTGPQGTTMLVTLPIDSNVQ